MTNAIEEMANAPLSRDALKLRSLIQDILRSKLPLSSWERPATSQHDTLVVAAALVELMASRRGVIAPAWTTVVGAMETPFHLLIAADRMPRLRAWCEAESPPPLRSRKLFAPPDFLNDV